MRQHPAFQAAAVYLGASWAIIEGSDILFPGSDLARWLAIVLALGFVALVGGLWWTARQRSSSDAEAEAAAPERRGRRRLAYGAAAGLLALGGLFWWIRPHILGAVEPDAQVIAVLPFNASGPQVEYLGEGMVDLLSTNLNGVGGIRAIDSRTVLHHWRQRAGEGGLDLEGSLDVGRDVDAGSVLLGSVVSAGSGVRLTAQLFSVRGSQLAEARAEGPADSVLAMVDSLGIHLLKEIWLAREPLPNLRVSGITTGNVDAIRHYLEGQAHFRRNEWEAALDAFQSAVQADTTFALALYRLGLTYGWARTHGGSEAREYAAAALRHADRLPERERRLVIAHKLFEDGDVAALDTLESYVRQYPSDPEGLYLLADVRFHAQRLVGLSLDRVLESFDRVLETDSSLAPALIHPLELALAYDDSAGYHRYLDALRGLAPPDFVRRYQAAALVWKDPDSLVDRFTDLVPGGMFYRVAGTAYSAPDRHPTLFLRLLEQVSALPGMGEEARRQFAEGRATLLASLGRLAEARPIFDSLRAFADPRQRAFYAAIAPVIAGMADSSFAGDAFDVLRDTTGPEWFSRYHLMIHALNHGRVDEARRLADEAAAADTTGIAPYYLRLIDAASGLADILEGDTAAGLARLESSLAEIGYAAGYPTELAAPLYLALGAIQARPPETRPEGLNRLRYPFGGGINPVYIPLYFVELGNALEAAGDSSGAVRAYTQFLHLWRDADPELDSRVEAVRRRLERLAGEQTE